MTRERHLQEPPFTVDRPHRRTARRAGSAPHLIPLAEGEERARILLDNRPLRALPPGAAHLRDARHAAERLRLGTVPFIHVLRTGRLRPVRDVGLAADASADATVMSPVRPGGPGTRPAAVLRRGRGDPTGRPATPDRGGSPTAHGGRHGDIAVVLTPEDTCSMAGAVVIPFRTRPPPGTAPPPSASEPSGMAYSCATHATG
ncbi:hypothetical protein [Streptomyces sp. NPDC005732]|uniref:hypothetical protein n=1 Tax=Streptomyces sp. NPDC005732 TaxID=3157057 RepID=UPI0033ED1755